MVGTLTTIGGWGAVAVVGAGTWYYYTQQGTNNKVSRKSGRGDQPVTARGGQKENRRKERSSVSDQGGGDVPELKASSLAGGGNEIVKQQKKNKKKKGITNNGSAIDSTSVTSHALPIAEHVNGREDADDKAFAHQFQTAREGTNLRTAGKDTKQVRTLKQGKANRSLQDQNSADVTESSTPPSTTGADADDDLSPGVSPSLNARPSKSDPHGISDMLERPSAGPSTLRLVPSKEPAHQAKPKKEKKVQEQETKKQRQRRAANEARKTENAEVEKQRRALMEKQMKLARTAEGTAKSGQYRTYANAPATNAWSGGNGAAAEDTAHADDPLLDTFETTTKTMERKAQLLGSESTNHVKDDDNHEPRVPGISNGAYGANGNALTAADLSSSSHSDEWENLQMRNIAQQEKKDDGWQEVPMKKSKKEKKNSAPADGQ